MDQPQQSGAFFDFLSGLPLWVAVIVLLLVCLIFRFDKIYMAISSEARAWKQLNHKLKTDHIKLSNKRNDQKAVQGRADSPAQNSTGSRRKVPSR